MRNTNYSDTLVESVLFELKLKGEVVNVGKKWYTESDFPDIAPDLSVVLKAIKVHPEHGVSLYSLMEITGLSEQLVRDELKFLLKQGIIYPNDSRYYPKFTPEPFKPHELSSYVDFLTRNELVALVKLFVQQTKWASESIEAAQKLINSRTYPIPVEIPRLHKPTNKEKFTIAGGQFAGISPDAEVNLDFGDFSD